MTPRRLDGAVVLIDGYNVIHKHAAWQNAALERGRESLIFHVRNLRWPFPVERSVIVFDAGENSAVSPAPGLQVRYATPSADAYIREAVRSAEDPTRLVVVSDDNEVLHTAKRFRAKILSSSWLLARGRVLKPQPSEGTAPAPGLSALQKRRINEELTKKWIDKEGGEGKKQ